MLKAIDLTTYLKTAIPYTYYVNEFPTTAADDIAYVRLTGGVAPSHDISMARPSFQVLLRAKSPSTAESKAFDIYAHFNNRRDFLVGTTRIMRCHAEQSSPIYIGADSNGRAVYSLNLTCITD